MKFLSLSLLLLTSIIIVSCEKDEVSIDVETDKNEVTSIEVRAPKDKVSEIDPVKQWRNLLKIEKDYNKHGNGKFKKDFGELDLSRIYIFSKSKKKDKNNGDVVSSRASTYLNYTAIPIVNEDDQIMSVAISEDKENSTKYSIYTSDVDMTDQFIQADNNLDYDVASFDFECDYFAKSPTGISSRCGFGSADDFESGDGSLPTLCILEACPRGFTIFKCAHPRVICESDLEDDDSGGTGGGDGGGGTTVGILIMDDNNGGTTFLGDIVSGSGGSGSYTLTFTRDELNDAIDAFNSRYGTDLTYHQLTSEENLGCLYFASQNYDNNNQDTDVLDYCMHRAVRVNRIMECTDADSEGIDILITAIGSSCDDATDYCGCLSNSIVIAEGGFLASHTCKGSFNFVPVGDGYTAQVEEIYHAYVNGADYVSYRVNVACIQVRGEDAFNQSLTKEKAAELTAFAMDNARLDIVEEVGGLYYNSNSAREGFRNLIVSNLLELTGGNTTSSVSFGNCSGTIPSTKYLVQPFGVFTCSHWY